MDVTLIIILHNRHANIARLAEYYKDTDASFILADSSTQKHPSSEIPGSWRHFYTPEVTYTKKIETVLQYVTTRYVILCADDDFIIPSAIQRCIHFLDTRPEYAAAQGNCLCFKKSELSSGLPVRFYPLYSQLDYAYESDQGPARIKHLLSNYKSLLYAVQRTAYLQQAYQGASDYIHNLYLNEYNASIIPIMLGKYKELPFLYQVREYAEDSDDKTAININTIIKNKAYEKDLNHFIKYVAGKVYKIIETNDTRQMEQQLLEGLQTLAYHIDAAASTPPSLKKRIGTLINFFPVIGSRIIAASREAGIQKKLAQVLHSPDDLEELQKIKAILSTYRQ